MPKIKPYVQLLNGCYRTEIAVSPTNWKTQAAKIFNKGKPVEWMIWYRFHDPAFRDKYPNGYPVKIRGMNKFKVLEQRQAHTSELLEIEHDLIDSQNYNPITQTLMKVEELQDEQQGDDILVDPQTPFITALEMGLKSKEMDPESKKDIANKIPHVKKAANMLKVKGKPMTIMPICEVSRKHMRAILNKIGKNKGVTWTANNFNRYRTDLHIIFAELNELEAMDVNPIDGIKKRKHAADEREVLTQDQLIKINAHLKSNNYTFWRFQKIFFLMGTRGVEMLRIERSHIDIPNLRYKVLIKKGEEYKWVWKSLEDEVLPLWNEIIKEADELEVKPGLKLYLFAEDLRPTYREKPIRMEHVTRRWQRHVKIKLNVTADLYSLKHLRTTSDIDTMVDAAIEEATKKAAKKNSHTSTAMVEKVYDVNKGRRAAIIRKLKYQKRRKAVVVRHGKTA